MDITEEIERAIGSGPPLPSPTDRLAAGKSAVRRRRLAAGAVAIVAVVLLGGTFSAIGLLDRDAKSDPDQVVVPNPDVPIDPDALQPGHIVGYDEDGRVVRRDDGITVTHLAEKVVGLDGLRNTLLRIERGGAPYLVLLYQNPGGSYYETSRGDAPEEFASRVDMMQELDATKTGRDPLESAPGAGFDSDGVLQLDPGARLIRRVDNPLEVKLPKRSAGLVIEVDDETYWVFVKPGVITSTPEARADYPTFDMWLAQHIAEARGRDTLQLVRFGADHQLVGLPGVTIVRQLDNAQLGDLRRPDEVSAVAEVRYQGRTWFVLATDLTSWKKPKHVFEPSVAKPGRETVAEYLDYLRSQREPIGATP